MPSASAIRAGQAVVEVGSDLNPLDRSLKLIEGKFAALGSRISNIGIALGAVGAAIAIKRTVIEPIANIVTHFAEAGSTISDMAARTGVGAQALSELGYAAGLSGSSIGDVETSIKKMQVAIAKGSDAFAAIGLDVLNLKRLAPEDQFELVAKKIAAIRDPATKTNAAIAILGKSGTKLLPMINDLDALKAEAKELGVAFDDVDAAKADELGDSFDRVKGAIAGIGNRLTSVFAGPLANALNQIAKIVGSVSNWVKENQAVTKQYARITLLIGGIGAATVAVGAAVAGLGFAFIGVGAAIAGITTIASAAVSAITGTIASLFTLHGAFFMAYFGLFRIVATGLIKVSGVTETISAGFNALGMTAVTAWKGIVAAISSGDIKEAGTIAFESLNVAWLTVTGTMQQVWQRSASYFVDVWQSMQKTLIETGLAPIYAIQDAWTTATTFMEQTWNRVFEVFFGAIDHLTTRLSQTMLTIGSMVGMVDKATAKASNMKFEQQFNQNLLNRNRDTNNVNRGLGDRRDKIIADREKTRQAFTKTLDDMFTRNKERFNPNEKAIDASRAKIQAAYNNLAARSQAAVEKAKTAQEVKAKKPELGQQEAQTRFALSSAGSVGTSASGVASRIAGVSVFEEKDKTMKDIAANTAKTNDYLAQLAQAQEDD